MKAQAQPAPIILQPDNQVTPVIIKIGGGGGPDGASIEIDSRFMDWTDDTGPTWNDAWSTSYARIYELTLRDGPAKVVFCKVQPSPNLLTTLKLYFDSADDTFELKEVQDDKGSIYLAAKSPGVSFEVEKPRTAGEWTRSKGTFPSALLKVEFKQRKIGSDDDLMTLQYGVNSNDIELGLDVHQT